MSKKTLYRIVIWVLLLAAVVVLIQLAPTLTKPAYLPIDDFFHLWAAGNQNLLRKNPFDAQAIDQLRIQAGSLPAISKIPVMLNPPWTVTLMMPFGLLSYPPSRLLWLIVSISVFLATALLLWKVYSGDPKKRWVSILAVFAFAPTISLLEKGQITFLAVFGMVGFLYFTVLHRNDWLAGASLALASVKPQIAILFWLALLFWVVRQKRWMVLVAFLITILALTAIALILNSRLIGEYIAMLQSYQMSDWATPTIGSYLRFFWLGTDRFWPQYLPAVLGALWFVYYWQKHHAAWNWAVELPVILLVSQLVSPYNWTYDLVIVLPAIILAARWVSDEKDRWIPAAIGLAFLAISGVDLVLHRSLDEFWFIWLAPVLLIMFLVISRRYASQPEDNKLASQGVG